jgi:methyl-accepting chemotaxis protein
MLKKLQNFQIANKILSILIGVAFLLFISITLFYSHIQKTKELDRVFISTIVLKNYFFKLEKNDNLFREKATEKKRNQFTKDLIVVKRFLKSLKRRFREHGLSQKYLNEFQRRIDRYGLAFDEFAKYESVGFFNKIVIDKLESSKERLRNNIYDMKTDHFLKDLLILEIDERDFMIYREDFFIKKFSRNFENFIKRVKRSGDLSNIEKNELLQSGENYHRVFAIIVESLTKSRGIKIELNELVKNLYSTTDDIIKESEREIHYMKRTSEILKLSIVAILTTVFIAFSIFVVNEIRRSIHRLRVNSAYFGTTFDLTKEIVLVGDSEIDAILKRLNFFIANLRHEFKLIKDSLAIFEREIDRVMTVNIYLKDRADNFDVEAGEKRSMVSELSVIKSRSSVLLDEVARLLTSSTTEFSEKTNIDQCRIKIDEISENNFEVNKCLDELNQIVKSDKNTNVSENLAKTFSSVVKTSNSISSTRGNFLRVYKNLTDLLENIKEIEERFSYLKENDEEFQKKVGYMLQKLSKIEETLNDFSDREREGLKHIYVISDTNKNLKDRLQNIKV